MDTVCGGTLVLTTGKHGLAGLYSIPNAARPLLSCSLTRLLCFFSLGPISVWMCGAVDWSRFQPELSWDKGARWESTYDDRVKACVADLKAGLLSALGVFFVEYKNSS